MLELQELLDEWVIACFFDRFKIKIASELHFYVTHMFAT